MAATDTAMRDALVQQRWFRAKGRQVVDVEVIDRATWQAEGLPLRLEVAAVRFAEGDDAWYLLVRSGDELDAIGEPKVARALLRKAFASARVPTEAGGEFVFFSDEPLHSVPLGQLEPPAPMGAEQSNSSIRFGDGLTLKLFRQLDRGINPEIEVAQFLLAYTRFRQMPLFAGSVNYREPGGDVRAAGVFQTFVPNRGDAWKTTLGRLEAALAGGDLDAAVSPMRPLGEATARLHVALASGRTPAFHPRPVEPVDVAGWTDEIEREMDETLGLLAERGIGAPGRETLRQRAAGLEHLVGTIAIRIHGDYHLGQVLEHDEGVFAIIDFEGEPLKPLHERRQRYPALRDVAGMLRSFDYARHSALRASAADPVRERRAARWHEAARAAFLDAYLAYVRPNAPSLLPSDEAGVRAALGALELQKALYEVRYERNNRPDWLPIPLAALG